MSHQSFPANKDSKKSDDEFKAEDLVPSAT